MFVPNLSTTWTLKVLAESPQNLAGYDILQKHDRQSFTVLHCLNPKPNSSTLYITINSSVDGAVHDAPLGLRAAHFELFDTFPFGKEEVRELQGVPQLLKFGVF